MGSKDEKFGDAWERETVRYQIFRKRPDDMEPILAFSADDKRFVEAFVKDASGPDRDWLYVHDTQPEQRYIVKNVDGRLCLYKEEGGVCVGEVIDHRGPPVAAPGRDKP